MQSEPRNGRSVLGPRGNSITNWRPPNTAPRYRFGLHAIVDFVDEVAKGFGIISVGDRAGGRARRATPGSRLHNGFSRIAQWNGDIDHGRGRISPANGRELTRMNADHNSMTYVIHVCHRSLLGRHGGRGTRKSLTGNNPRSALRPTPGSGRTKLKVVSNSKLASPDQLWAVSRLATSRRSRFARSAASSSHGQIPE